MSVIELRKKIIEEISSITDESILSEVYELIHLEKKVEYTLTHQELSAVQEGIDDVTQNRIFSTQEAESIIKEWLKK